MIAGIVYASFTVSDLATAERFFAETLNMKRLGGGEYGGCASSRRHSR